MPPPQPPVGRYQIVNCGELQGKTKVNVMNCLQLYRSYVPCLGSCVFIFLFASHVISLTSHIVYGA